MFFVSSINRHPAFREAARQMLPLSTGIAAWGLMTGVAMVKSGLSVVEALAMTFFVYAGSSQLAALPLIIAGAPVWVILATGFCVNLRFVVFSLHLREYLMAMPRWRRMLHGYLTADMSYALFVRRFASPPATEAERNEQEAFLAGNYCVTWNAWVWPGVAGIALANFIPTEWGLGFAGVLCLVGVTCSLANTAARAVAGVVAACVGVAAFALPLRMNIVLAIALAVLAGYWVSQFAPKLESERR